MPFLRSLLQPVKPFGLTVLVLLCHSALSSHAAAQDAPSVQPPVSSYDKAIFLKPIPADELTPLKQYDNAPAKDLMRDKVFRKMMHSAIPDCEFHYGRDMSLSDAIDMVMKDSTEPVLIRDGRYLTVGGSKGPYLAGKGMLWIDLQDGILLGGFYFHPTNGEPTPSVNIFSRQVKEKELKMSQLPPEFVNDFIQWATPSHVPPLTTRYFLTGLNKKILLEHDEDYCMHADGSVEPPDSGCRQMNADAADIDVNAAYYLEQVHYATNATAWMITGEDQVAWLQVRSNACGVGPDPLGCRIRMTRERTHVIVSRPPMAHVPVGHR